MSKLAGLLSLTSVLAVSSLHAEEINLGYEALMDLSLEQLLDIEVTSVSKRSEKLSTAASAIFVITGNDIKRSGVTSIADALRMVPGLHVAKIDSNKWAVSARGFNGLYSNKLLVLMDGRSVYSTSMSGVYWDAQDVVLDDIERVEVIRGPGATLWGANAVNGIINIISKNASKTQGSLLTVRAGSGDEYAAAWRTGGKISGQTFYRSYAKFRQVADSALLDKQDDANDRWSMGRAGFRVDKTVGINQLNVQADVYQGVTEQTLVSNIDYTTNQVGLVSLPHEVDQLGFNFMTSWRAANEDGSRVSSQFYIDHVERKELVQDERQDIIDLELQYQSKPYGSHTFTVGGGWRYTNHRTRHTGTLNFLPAEDDSDLFNVFLQDDISLLSDRWHISLGSKFERNQFSNQNIEIQPSIRSSFQLTENNSLWGSVSKAVRVPSRGEQQADVHLSVLPTSPLPTVLRSNPSAEMKSEELIAYELGYRSQLSSRLSMDVALFVHEYEDLRTLGAISAPACSPSPCSASSDYAVVRVDFENTITNQSRGVELAVEWGIRKDWILKGAYSYIEMDEEVIGVGAATSQVSELDSPAKHIASLRSQYQFNPKLQFDLWLRYVDELEGTTIGSYSAVDFKLNWTLRPDVELSLVGQNIFDPQHAEFSPEIIAVQATELRRGFYAKASWSF